jgi:hypothetical protein
MRKIILINCLMLMFMGNPAQADELAESVDQQ